MTWLSSHATAAGLMSAVVDGLAEGVIVRDAENRLLLCNPAAESIIGLRPEELADFPDLPGGWTAIDAEGRPLAHGDQAAAVCRRTAAPVRGQLTGLRRPDGSVLWLAVNAHMLGGSPGAVAGAPVVVSFIDVTTTRELTLERERLQQRLDRVNALRLAAGRAMLEAPDGVTLAERTCAIATRDVGFLLAWIGAPDTAAGVVRPIAAAGDTAYLTDLVVTLDPADPRSQGPTGVAVREGRTAVNRDTGTSVAMSPWREPALRHGLRASAAFPLPGDGERAVLTVYAAEPDFFNAEETALLEQFAADVAVGLREASSRRLLAAVTANMGEGLIAIDADGRLRYANPMATKLLGWSGADLATGEVHALLHPQGTGGSPCTPEGCALLGAPPAGEAAVRGEGEFARADGSALPVAFTVTPLDGGGDGTILVFADDTRRRQEAQRLRAELERLTGAARVADALAGDGFELHAQPIVDLADGRTVQHELLIRLREEDGTLVPPGDFLPTAEACGLMPAVDRWVIERAGALARAGHAVQFNLSAASLGDPGMLAFMEATLLGAGAPGALICEVTETAFIADRVTAEAFLSRLEHLGIQVALDDFGSGYGAFSYLKAFPAHYLKIDAEFVGDLADHPASRHVVEAIVRLARGLGKRTVAEGVEDVTLLPLLLELGVDLAQGFALGRPAPVDEVFPSR